MPHRLSTVQITVLRAIGQNQIPEFPRHQGTVRALCEAGLLRVRCGGQQAAVYALTPAGRKLAATLEEEAQAKSLFPLKAIFGSVPNRS